VGAAAHTAYYHHQTPQHHSQHEWKDRRQCSWRRQLGRRPSRVHGGLTDVRTVAGREQLEQLATLSSDYSLREKANRVLHLLATAPPEPGAELTSPRPFSNAFSNAFPNASVPPGARPTPFPALRDGTHAHHARAVRGQGGRTRR
jgi:hypothetical protein